MTTLTLYPVKDTYVCQCHPTTPHGSAEDIWIANESYIGYGLFEFDMSSLDADAVISAATFKIYYYDTDYDPVGRTLSAWRMTKDFTESTITYNGLDALLPYTGTPVSYAVMPASYGWVEFDFKELVEDARANRSDVIRVRVSMSTYYSLHKDSYFRSKEYTGTTYDPQVVITYAIPAAPTNTTQACSSTTSTQTTGNGNITDDGGATVTRRGFCYKAGTTGDPTIADSIAYDDGSFSTGAYTKNITGLSGGTSYRVRAYATNSEGTGYGTTVTVLTKPAAPTSVAATKGDHTDKVVVTWTKSTSATAYEVYRDDVLVDTLGDVATYDDEAADAPTITAGTAVAGDGADLAHVALSLSGESADNGTTHTYYVIATNATGDSPSSNEDTGYMGVGSLTYQWQRSAADSDADYSNIEDATTESYNDTGAPADGSGRYYQCVLNATGAVEATSDPDRGYRDTETVPVLTTADAASTEETTVTLGGEVTRRGGSAITERGVEYDTDTGAPYTTPQSTEGEFGTGVFTEDITGLTKGELYYYRAFAVNSTGTGYGDEKTVLTKPDPPTNLVLTPDNGKITVSWDAATGADKYIVRAKLGSYPTSITDGDEIYNDADATYTHTGLTNGAQWYYRLWSYVTEGGLEQYSDTYVQDNACAAAQAWYDVNYGYRIPITVTTPIDDGVVWIKIGKTSDAVGEDLDLGGNVRDDFFDLVATESDGVTKLYHYVEYIEDSGGTKLATVAIKQAAAAESVIYLYYGYAALASDNSDGPNTFIQIEDFEWGSDGDDLDTDGGTVDWTAGGSGTSVADIDTAQAFRGTRSGRLYRDGTNIPFAQWPQVAGSDYAIRFRHRKDATSESRLYHGNGTKMIQLAIQADEDIVYYDTAWQDTGSNVTEATWELFELKALNFTAGTFEIWFNGSKIADATMRTIASYQDVARFTNEVGTSEVWLDNLIVYKACASTFAYGAEEEAPAAALISTNDASSVEESTATTGGNIENLYAGGNATERGVNYGVISATYSDESSEEGDFGTGSFNRSLTNLEKGTLYYFQAFCVTPLGTGYGSEKNFLTKPDEPSDLVITQGDGSLAVSWAKGAGAQYSIARYKTGSYPTSVTDGTSAYNGTGNSCEISGLTNGTTYYIRVWSYVSAGGLEQYSDTYVSGTNYPVDTPNVVTSECTSTGLSTTQGNGYITETGGENATERGFCYIEGITGTPTTSDTCVTEVGDFSTGTFNLIITGFKPGTSYRVCAYATNPSGTGYGDVVDVTTISVEAALTAEQKNLNLKPHVYLTRHSVTYPEKTGGAGSAATAGIQWKDLEWTKIFEGELTPTYHGMAISVSGSTVYMHRVKGDTAYAYYQRKVNPGTSTNFATGWSRLDAISTGPVGIATHDAYVILLWDGTAHTALGTGYTGVCMRLSSDYGATFANELCINQTARGQTAVSVFEGATTWCVACVDSTNGYLHIAFPAWNKSGDGYSSTTFYDNEEEELLAVTGYYDGDYNFICLCLSEGGVISLKRVVYGAGYRVTAGEWSDYESLGLGSGSISLHNLSRMYLSRQEPYSDFGTLAEMYTRQYLPGQVRGNQQFKPLTTFQGVLQKDPQRWTLANIVQGANATDNLGAGNPFLCTITGESPILSITKPDEVWFFRLKEDTDFYDSHWSQAFKENDSIPYGLDVASDGTYLWASGVNHVWRATLPGHGWSVPTGTLIVTTATPTKTFSRTDIPIMVEQRNLHAKSILQLHINNSAGTYTRSNLSSLWTSEGYLLKPNLGYTIEGTGYAVGIPWYYIDSWFFYNMAGREHLYLQCIDEWGRLENCKATGPHEFNYFDDDYTVYEIIQEIFKRIRGNSFALPYISRSTGITSIYPKFKVQPGESAADAVRRLLSLVTDVLIFRGNTPYIINPQTSDTSSYTYINPRASTDTDHGMVNYMLGKSAYGINRFYVIGEDADGNTLIGADENTTQQGFVGERFMPFTEPGLITQANVDAVAGYKEEKERLNAYAGNIIIATNCSGELADVVKCKFHADENGSNYRVMGIETRFNQIELEYRQYIKLSEV